MKYRARTRNIYYPTDDAMTLDQVLSMFEKVDEPEEIEDLELAYIPLTNNELTEIIYKINELAKAVNALRRKE